MKSITEINEKLKGGEAVVLTAQEFKDAVRDNKKMSPDDVDVVTTATFGVMSGTAAVLSIPVGERGQFKSARDVLLNDVPAFPGPCPNESLGLVEAILYGTASSRKDPKRYGGGHVFHDLASGKEINVTVETLEGDTIEKVITLPDLESARMFTTRACFKNYMGIINTKESVAETIFSVHGLMGPYREATVSGCGELNPLENDPHLKIIGVGTKILLNGAIGYITGMGTRSSRERPNLTLTGDMGKMMPEYMGGFITSHTPDCMTSVAIPIPVIDREVFECLRILDEQIELPIVDIHDRVPIASTHYGNVWHGKDQKIDFVREACAPCTHLGPNSCAVEKACPSASFSQEGGIDPNRCFRCGSCVFSCPENALRSNLGVIEVHGRQVPITLRQSCRAKAEAIAFELRNRLHDGSFTLTDKVDDLDLG